MSITEEYRKIYDKEICRELKQEIAIYDEEKGLNSYQPLSHNCAYNCVTNCNHNCYKRLGCLASVLTVQLK